MALASAQKGTLLRRGPNLVSGLRYRCGLEFYFARGRYCKSEGVRNRRARHQHGEYIVPRTVALEGKVEPDDVAADGLHFADRRAECSGARRRFVRSVERRGYRPTAYVPRHANCEPDHLSLSGCTQT